MTAPRPAAATPEPVCSPGPAAPTGRTQPSKPGPASCEQFLRPDEPLRHPHPVRALYGALGTLVAAHARHFVRQLQEAFTRQTELPVAFRVGEETQHVRHRHAVGTLAFTRAAHAAVERAQVLKLRRQRLLVLFAELRRHA